MKDKSLVVAKINLRNIKLAYIITGIVIACIIAQDIVLFILDKLDIFKNGPDNSNIGIGNYLFLIAILGPIFISSMNFRKMMNLGGKRADFFNGSAMTYIIMAAAISLAGLILYYTYDRLLIQVYYGGGTLNVMHVFRWMDNGPIVAFLRQFSFLYLFATFIHTLVAAQDKWYGWVADIVLVAIISVFPPIAPLRAALVWFFNMILFHPVAVVQVASCLILAVLIHMLNKPILARKVI